jgi:hypothetical protein
MTRTKLFLTAILLLSGATQVLAGGGQNGPIGPGSRYGLEPSPDDATTAFSGYNSHASMTEVRPGNAMLHPRDRHRRHQSG